MSGYTIQVPNAKGKFLGNFGKFYTKYCWDTITC